MSPDVHTMTGAYAVNALTEQEREVFEQHLQQCGACQDEVRELQETTAALAADAAQQPSPEFTARVLAEVANTRQLPPARQEDELSRRRGRRRGRVVRTIVGVAAAAALVVGGLSAYQTVQLRDRLDRAEQANAAMTAVLAAPDARASGARIGAAAGKLVVSRSSRQAVFVSTGLATPPPGKDYQVWFIGAGGARSAGLLRGPGGGTATVVSGLPEGAEKLGVTVEPRGGSRAPTTKPFMLMSVPT